MDGPATFGATQVTMSSTLAWRSIPGPDDTVLTLHQRSQVDEISVQPGGYGGAAELSRKRRDTHGCGGPR